MSALLLAGASGAAALTSGRRGTLYTEALPSGSGLWTWEWEVGSGKWGLRSLEKSWTTCPAGTSSVAGPPLPVNELAAARSPGREPGCDGGRRVGARLTEGYGLAHRDPRRSLHPQREPHVPDMAVPRRDPNHVVSRVGVGDVEDVSAGRQDDAGQRHVLAERQGRPVGAPRVGRCDQPRRDQSDDRQHHLPKQCVVIDVPHLAPPCCEMDCRCGPGRASVCRVTPDV